MIEITADEARYLRDNRRGHDVMMSSKTHKSRSKTYFAVESYKSLQLLRKYRESRIVSSYGG